MSVVLRGIASLLAAVLFVAVVICGPEAFAQDEMAAVGAIAPMGCCSDGGPGVDLAASASISSGLTDRARDGLVEAALCTFTDIQQYLINDGNSLNDEWQSWDPSIVVTRYMALEREMSALRGSLCDPVGVAALSGTAHVHRESECELLRNSLARYQRITRHFRTQAHLEDVDPASWTPEQIAAFGRAIQGGLRYYYNRAARESSGTEDHVDDSSLRMILLYGVPEPRRHEVWSHLHGRHAGSDEAGTLFVNNGYRLGGGRSGTAHASYDCSDFVGRVLSGDSAGAATPTVSDYMAVGASLASSGLDAVVASAELTYRTYATMSAEWRGLEDCFSLVRPSAGQPPQAGDVVAYSRGGSNHIVFIRSFDMGTGIATTIEAADERRGLVQGHRTVEGYAPFASCAAAEIMSRADAPREELNSLPPDAYYLRPRGSPGPNCPARIADRLRSGIGLE